MALKKQSTLKRWRSKEGIASGHLKVTGPGGSAIFASAPNSGRTGERAVHNTLATIRSKTGLEV
jgi:hypothetical protein